MTWDCSPGVPYVTGAVVGFCLAVPLCLWWCRWNRRGGKIELTRSFDSPTVGE